MANKARQNLELSMEAFNNNDDKLVEKVYENEKIINVLEEAITAYLVKLSKCDLSDKEKNIVAATFHVITDIERIGDHAENIAELALQKSFKKIKYSQEAIKELEIVYNNTLEALSISIEAYENRDLSKADTVYGVEQKIDVSQKEYRDNHIKRLNEGKCGAL